jgi:hypothetical protein
MYATFVVNVSSVIKIRWGDFKKIYEITDVSNGRNYRIIYSYYPSLLKAAHSVSCLICSDALLCIIISQKTEFFIATIVRTSNPAYCHVWE